MPNNQSIRESTTEESEYVRNKLIEYNSKNTLNGRFEEVNLCVKDDTERIIGGLNSAIIWNWMEIDILWVDDEFRRRGYGSSLLNEAERMARNNDCTFIKLNTFSFQAPEFYLKHGYSMVAIIEDAPTGSKEYFYKKDLKIGELRKQFEEGNNIV